MAAKVLKTSVAAIDGDALLAEARLLALCNGHPHVVHLYGRLRHVQLGGLHKAACSHNQSTATGIVNSGDTVAIVTELCKHGSLESYLQVQARKGAPVPMYRRLQLLSEAAAGLYHLHCHRVVHRDVAARCGVCVCVVGQQAVMLGHTLGCIAGTYW